jgi:hypothetical protein
MLKSSRGVSLHSFLIKRHKLNAYGGKVIYSFLTSVLDGGVLLASQSGKLLYSRTG